MSSLLRDIISGAESSNSVLIEDNVHVTRGRDLLKCFAASTKNALSHVFVNEVDPNTWRETGNYVYDNYKDPLNWDRSKTDSAFSTEHFIATMDEQIKMADSSLPSNHHVVIDSLTVLLRRQGLPAVATLLHTLPGSQLTSRGSVARLVSYLHGDLHSNSDLQCLEQMATTVIHLDKSPVPGKQLCTITHVKRSGKVLRKREVFHIGEDLAVVSSEFVTAKCNSEQQPSDNADPTAGLSFNLTLSNKEKRDRSQVQLPYKYTETQKAEQLEGRVFYQPDDVDDWDDSDPDDDLDI